MSRRRSLIGGSKPARGEAPAAELHEDLVGPDESPTTAPEADRSEAVEDPPTPPTGGAIDPAVLAELEAAGPVAPPIPHSGDPDSYSELETQMDDARPHADAFADTGTFEPLADGLDLDEAPTRDDPGRYAGDAPPMQGALDDDADLYGDFSGLGNPPTEEVQLYQDVSQPHNAPMHVPEPPAIPGIADRFTPPPVERSEIGARQSGSRPSYLATPTPTPAERELFPEKGARDKHAALVMTKEDRKKTTTVRDDDDEEAAPGMLRYLVGGGVVVLMLLAALAWGAKELFLGGPEVVVGGDVPEDIRGVRVEKGGVKKEGPEMLGDLDGVDDPSTRPEPAPAPEGDPGEEEAPEVPPGPPPMPETAPAPAPAPVEAAPKPKPKRTEAPKAVASKIQVRANRKALVYIDGKAVGYTPLDYPTSVGGHEVVAMIAGQPATRQTKTATIAKDGDQPSVEFKF